VFSFPVETKEYLLQPLSIYFDLAKRRIRSRKSSCWKRSRVRAGFHLCE